MYSRPNISTYSDLIDIDEVRKSSNKSKKSIYNSNEQTNFVKTNSWTRNNHKVTICFTPDNNIYINIISSTTFVNYDGYIKSSDLENGLDLNSVYTMITKAFNLEHNYSIDWKFDRNSLSINVSALMDGYFSISHTFTLEEKILSDDKVLTIKLSEMESRHQAEITELKKIINDLETQPIIFAHNPNKFGDYLSYPSNTMVFDFTKADGFSWHGNYMDFNKLKKLFKIIMFNSNFKYSRNVKDICSTSYSYLNHIKSNTGDTTLCSLDNIFNIPQIFLPSVLELEVKYNTGELIPQKLNSLPNLKIVSFVNFNNTNLTSFELVKNIPQLSHLIYSGCLQINNLDQIKNWCDSKNIKLEIK